MRNLCERNPRAIGSHIETLAEHYLSQHGFTILHKNFRCKLGEIDLIGRDPKTLIFVEVRYRKNNHYGSPAETITPIKQRKLIRTAQFFLKKYPALEKLPCRFDVISVTLINNKPSIEWIPHAFES